MCARASTRAHGDNGTNDRLSALPAELQAAIAEHLHDFADCARFALASPRLALVARGAGVARFRDPLFWIALASQRGVDEPCLNEEFLRWYARRAATTTAHFAWIRAQSPDLFLHRLGGMQKEEWSLVRNGQWYAKVRVVWYTTGRSKHYAGVHPHERKVATHDVDGRVRHYVGERKQERLHLCRLACGTELLYEGARHAECLRLARHSRWQIRFSGAKKFEKATRVIMRRKGARRDAVLHLKGCRECERPTTTDEKTAVWWRWAQPLLAHVRRALG